MKTPINALDSELSYHIGDNWTAVEAALMCGNREGYRQSCQARFGADGALHLDRTLNFTAMNNGSACLVLFAPGEVCMPCVFGLPWLLSKGDIVSLHESAVTHIPRV